MKTTTPLWTLGNLMSGLGISPREMRELRAHAKMPRPVEVDREGTEWFDPDELCTFVRRIRPTIRTGSPR